MDTKVKAGALKCPKLRFYEGSTQSYFIAHNRAIQNMKLDFFYWTKHPIGGVSVDYEL